MISASMKSAGRTLFYDNYRFPEIGTTTIQTSTIAITIPLRCMAGNFWLREPKYFYKTWSDQLWVKKLASDNVEAPGAPGVDFRASRTVLWLCLPKAAPSPS